MRYLSLTITLLFTACTDLGPKTWTQAEANKPATASEEISILPNCDSAANTPCFNTHIPNHCPNGFEEIGFCRNWPSRQIIDGKTFDNRNAQLDFEMPIELNNQRTHARIVFKNVFPSPCGNDALIGFHGYSEDGFPIISSERGALEVRHSDVSIGYQDARLVIDVNRKLIIARYGAPHDNETLWSFQFDITGQAFLNTAGQCFKLPRNYDGPIENTSISKCEADIGQWNKDGGTIPANSKDIDIARTVLISEDFDLEWLEFVFGQTDNVKRISGTNFVVVNLVIACT